MSNLKQWDKSDQISELKGPSNDIFLEKIEWFHNKYGIISLRLTLSNGHISPVLGNQHPDYRPNEEFSIENGTKIKKIIFKEYVYGYTNIQLFD